MPLNIPKAISQITEYDLFAHGFVVVKQAPKPSHRTYAHPDSLKLTKRFYTFYEACKVVSKIWEHEAANPPEQNAAGGGGE